MRRISMKELEEDLRARGIPEYARKLAEKYGYDSLKRKAARNPEELELILEVRRKKRHPDTT
jgi:hypothetical protein